MNWHPCAALWDLLKGAEWEAFKASVQASGGNEMPILYRMKDGERQGLDGRNRWNACEELGLEPKVEEVQVADEDVGAYIKLRNHDRRHDSPESRKRIVAELREQGLSIRQIAETIGEPRSTVADDVKATANVETQVSGAGRLNKSNGSSKDKPMPHTRRITGKDGKSYPASKPVYFCARCQRIKTASCDECRKNGAVLRPEGPAKPQNATAVPASPQPAPKASSRRPHFDAQPVLDWLAKIDSAFDKLAEARPDIADEGMDHNAALNALSELTDWWVAAKTIMETEPATSEM